MAVTCFVAACNVIWGIDDRSGDSAGEGGAEPASSATTGGGGAFSIEAAPAGWQGPLLFSRGGSMAELSACGDSYDSQVFVLRGDVTPGEHVCPCECAAAEGIGCTVSVTSWADEACTVPLRVDTFANVSQCREIDDDTRAASFPEPAVDTTNASCAATPGAPMITPAAFAEQGRACGPVDALDALPPGFDACIYQLGDVPCPGAPYTERTLWYSGVEDTRGCMDDCSCGAVDVAQCTAVVDANGGHSCNENPDYPLLVEPGCVPGYFDSARLISVTPQGSCQPIDATATGALTLLDATTVCCAR